MSPLVSLRLLLTLFNRLGRMVDAVAYENTGVDENLSVHGLPIDERFCRLYFVALHDSYDFVNVLAEVPTNNWASRKTRVIESIYV